MDFRILGPIEVVADGRPLDLGGHKQRALLAVLLLDAGRVVSRDRLIDALWDEDPPATAPKTRGRTGSCPERRLAQARGVAGTYIRSR